MKKQTQYDFDDGDKIHYQRKNKDLSKKYRKQIYKYEDLLDEDSCEYGEQQLHEVTLGYD